MPHLQLPEDHIITAADAREQARHTISMRKIRKRVTPQRAASQPSPSTPEMVVDKYLKTKIDEIAEHVLEHVHAQFGVKVEDILSGSVTHNHSTPRHVAMYLIEKMALCNAREVGERFNRTKSVVRKSCQRVESFLKNAPNDKISRAVTSITRQLTKEGMKL